MHSLKEYDEKFDKWWEEFITLGAFPENMLPSNRLVAKFAPYNAFDEGKTAQDFADEVCMALHKREVGGMMNEQEMECYLAKVLDEASLAFDDVTFEGYLTFHEAGVLTKNRGLVLRMSDKSQFQITIVKSA